MPVPDAPLNLAAVAGDAQVTLTWQAAPADALLLEDGTALLLEDGTPLLLEAAAPAALTYNVYRGTSSGGEVLLQSGLTLLTFLDTTVTNGVTYYYEVTAVNGGESAFSNEVSATPVGVVTTRTPQPSLPSATNTFGVTFGDGGPLHLARLYGRQKPRVVVPGLTGREILGQAFARIEADRKEKRRRRRRLLMLMLMED